MVKEIVTDMFMLRQKSEKADRKDLCCPTRKTKKCDTQKRKKDHLRGEKIPLKWSLINL